MKNRLQTLLFSNANLYRYNTETNMRDQFEAMRVKADPDAVVDAIYRRWGLYKLNGVGPWLEIAWFQPLYLTCDILDSKSAFKVCFQRQLVPLQLGAVHLRRQRRVQAP